MFLVVGVTNTLGCRIAQGLLNKGNKVRILISRNIAFVGLARPGLMASIQSLIDAGAKPVWGDLRSESSLLAALKDVDTVIDTLNGAKHWGADSIESRDWQDTSNLVSVAQAAGVRRFLLTSTPGHYSGYSGPLDEVDNNYERLMQESGLNYTIVRPTMLMEVWIGLMIGIPMMTQQAVTLIGQGNHAHNFVSELDVANYCIAMVDHAEAYNKVVTVGGPASYTWSEIVFQMRDRMGAELPIQYAMAGTPIPYLPQGANVLASNFEKFEDYLDITEVSTRFGIKPTTLEEFIERTFVRQ